MNGEAKLRLPYPDVQFDRFRKRLRPGTYGPHMQRTDERVFEDRANSRRHWKILRRLVAELDREGFHYSVEWSFDDKEATAVVRYRRPS